MCPPSNVVILSAEDGLGDTIRPRLEAAGADLSRIEALTAIRRPDGAEDLPSIAENVDQIEEAVVRTGARLVVIDPLMAFLGPRVDSYRDQDVRRALARLTAMAERTGAAVVVVRHLKKSKEGGAINAGGGSIGIIGAARSGLLVAADPEDSERRVLAPVKSNLCKPPASLAYRVEVDQEGRPFVAWDPEPVSISADRLLASAAGGEEERSAREDARAFLREFLLDGPKPSTQVFKAARAQGISERTLRRAFSGLGGKAGKAAFSGGWVWALPGEGGHEDAKMAKVPDKKGWPSSDGIVHLRESGPAAQLAEFPCSYHVGGLGGPCNRCWHSYKEHIALPSQAAPAPAVPDSGTPDWWDE
jgi:hypothetical protein